MNSYEVRVLQEGEVISSGYGNGASACEALENAFKSGVVYRPSGTDAFTALVLNHDGLIFRFELGAATQI